MAHSRNAHEGFLISDDQIRGAQREDRTRGSGAVVKPLLIFLGSMLLSAATHAALSSCAQDDERPSCGGYTRLPDKLSVLLPIEKVTGNDAVFRPVEPAIDLGGGTVEVTGEQVIVRYTVLNTPRTVVYDVLPAE